jgi:long-subunit acyl-CoA synthetase (AMP-forming)
MVEANSLGDGIERRIQYAKFRTDKPATPGYSTELISNTVDAKYFDDLEAQPIGDCDTILKTYHRSLLARGNEQFLGTRAELEEKVDGKTVYGEYTW